MTEEEVTPENSAQPDAAELITHLEERLGADGLKSLVVGCLRASDRSRAVQVINAAVGNIRLPASTDRGRMGRLIMEGLGRRRETVLDAVQIFDQFVVDVHSNVAPNRNVSVHDGFQDPRSAADIEN